MHDKNFEKLVEDLQEGFMKENPDVDEESEEFIYNLEASFRELYKEYSFLHSFSLDQLMDFVSKAVSKVHAQMHDESNEN